MISRRQHEYASTIPAPADDHHEEPGSLVLRRAERALPRIAHQHYLQAMRAVERADSADAEAHLRQALHYAPDFAEALYELGLIRASVGDRHGARHLLLSALRASERKPPQPELAMRIAEQLALLLGSR
jgi:Flp pilus assembly protein TadD